MLYKAFISYSHAADGKLAPALQKALHRFAKPWYKIRALRIFRDETNLSMAPELLGAILKALSNSEYFILLASPKASSSPWVQEEVNFWLKNKPKHTLFIILTEGEIVWDSAADDFNWNLTTALPKNLEKVFSAEPYYIDLRRQKEENQLSLGDPQFLDAVATIAATLHGKSSKDEIVGEDIQQHKVTKRWILSAITTLVALLVASLVGFCTAEQQRDRALVEKFHLQATSAIEKPGDINGDPIHAHLLAAQAYQLQPDNPTAYKSLLSTLLSSHTNQYLYGHKQDITKVTYSPDGSHLASIGNDGLILWEMHQDKAKEKWRDFSGSVSAVAFSPDNQQIVGGGNNGNLILWDISSGKKLPIIQGKDTENNKTTSTRITSISSSADGKQLLTAHEGGMLKLWDVSQGRKIKEWQGHNGGHIEALFHPKDGKLIISYRIDSASDSLHMKLWNLDNLKVIKKWEITKGSDESVTYEPTIISPDGNHILSKYLLSLLLWNMNSSETLKKKLELNDGELLLEGVGSGLFAFNSDGKKFVSNYVDITNSILNIWNFDHDKTKDKDKMPKLKVKWNDVRELYSLAFSPNDKQIAGGGKDGRLIIWNIFAGDRLTQPWLELIETGADGIADFAFSNNEKRFASILDFSGAKIFDYDINHKRFVLKREIHRKSKDIAVLSIALSLDGEMLLLGGNDFEGPIIEIWSLASGEQNITPIKKLSASGSSTFKHIAFSKNNKQIYGITAEGVLVSWDGATFRRKEIPLKGNRDPITRAAFSPDRKILLTGSDSDGIRLWDTDTGECYKGSTENCRIQPGHEESSIGGIAFSPDGKLAVSTSLTSLWVLWDIATGDVIARKKSDDSDMEQNFGRVYFRSDDKILFYTSGSNYKDNNEWVLWDVNPANLAVQACEVVGRTFTPQEWEKFIGNKSLDYKERACNIQQ